MTATLRRVYPDAQAEVAVDSLRPLLERQRRAFAAGPPRHADRIAALRGLERALQDRRDEIVQAIGRDFGGRAAEETLALELFPLLNEIRHACRHLSGWMRPRRAAVQWQFWPGRARVMHEPVGVVGILSTWNYPFYLSLAPLVGAVAAGNHVLLKPSELAPASAALMRALLADLFPPEYVALVTGGAETAAAFSRLPLDHLVFTGSPRVGRLVMRAASEHLVPVTLELGGKSPALVHPSFPLATAVKRIVTGKLYNAGQTCVAPDYALVARGQRDAFAAAAAAEIRRMYPTLVRNQDYTRIINPAQYRRLQELVEDARWRGAEVVEVHPAGEVCDEGNRVFPPTILTGVRDDMAIAHEEIFGPILPVIEYDTVEDAIAYVNARPHPLAFYYFDLDRRRVDDVVGRVAAGGVTVNDCIFHVGQAALPFGGVGGSGMGRYHGFAGFQAFSNRKGVFHQGRWSPLGLLRPPYGAGARRLLRFLLD